MPCCRKLWSLKEAFVKATGEGLGFELGNTDFNITGTTGALFSGLSLHIFSTFPCPD